MPNRLSRLAAVAQLRDGLFQGGALPCPARPGMNDNAGSSDEGMAAVAGPPEPEWHGPGAILALGTQDGQHGLGAVRAACAAEATGDPVEDMATLLRLLAHYGLWLGFEGRAEPVRTGKMRRLPRMVEGQGPVEYRLDVRRIARDAQRLTADGTILLNGHPTAKLEGLSIAFRAEPEP